MPRKTITTCDHCGKEVDDGISLSVATTPGCQVLSTFDVCGTECLAAILGGLHRIALVRVYVGGPPRAE